jgi:putative membrane protein
LAPKTTEDLPQELGDIVKEEARKIGFDTAILINAHNSLTIKTEIEASLEELRDVAVRCLRTAFEQKVYPFEIGSKTLHPTEFSLKDGMGSGGITAIIVKVADQKSAYIVIDGNNMVSGLREKCLSALKNAGFGEGEVFTTDTHAVSAVVIGRRGYHPIGEAMNHEHLINLVRVAAIDASNKLELCNAGYRTIIVPKVRVIGSECLQYLSTLVDKTIQKAKRIIVPIFATEGLLLFLIFALL